MACIEISAENITAPHLDIEATHICMVSEGDKGVPTEFSFRASGGKSIRDGAARIKRLRGNSVVWNQKIDPTKLGINGADITETDNEIIIVPPVGDNGNRYGTPFNAIEGHYYLQTVDIRSENGGEVGFQNYLYLDIWNKTTSTSYVRLWGITQSTASGEAYIQIMGMDGAAYRIKKGTFNLVDLTLMFDAGNEPTTIEEFYARKPIVEDEYAYNDGEVIHMTAEGIKSVGDNAWDEEWENGRFNTTDGSNIADDSTMRMKNAIKVLPNATYYCNSPVDTWMFFLDNDGKVIEGYSTGLEKYQNACKVNNSPFTTPRNAAYIKAYFNQYLLSVTTYNHDIMITLVHSGWKQDTDAGYQPYWEDKLMFDERIKEHFPDGMKKWDMVYNKNGKGYVVKGTGVVDLGSLSWYDDTFNGVPTFTTQDVTNGVVRSIYGSLGGSIIALYSEMAEFGHLATSDNKVFVFNAVAHSPNTLAVRDTSYTDAASFKAAMAGVMLYYELAEPTIIEYDEPFNLDYRVADFGTEQMLTEQPSAPISANIAYALNL